MAEHASPWAVACRHCTHARPHTYGDKNMCWASNCACTRFAPMQHERVGALRGRLLTLTPLWLFAMILSLVLQSVVMFGIACALMACGGVLSYVIDPYRRSEDGSKIPMNARPKDAIQMTCLCPIGVMGWGHMAFDTIRNEISEKGKIAKKDAAHPLSAEVILVRGQLNKVLAEIERVGQTPDLEMAREAALRTLRKLEDLPHQMDREAAKVTAANVIQDLIDVQGNMRQFEAAHQQMLVEGHGQQLEFLEKFKRGDLQRELNDGTNP